ncbi:MAG: hypothetical protein WC527_05340 [Candidatus Margulisiibacteriota bacterium]
MLTVHLNLEHRVVTARGLARNYCSRLNTQDFSNGVSIIAYSGRNKDLTLVPGKEGLRCKEMNMTMPWMGKVARQLSACGVTQLTLHKPESITETAEKLIQTVFRTLTTRTIPSAVETLSLFPVNFEVEGISTDFTLQDLFEASTAGRTMRWAHTLSQPRAITEYLALRPFMKPALIAKTILDKFPVRHIVLFGEALAGIRASDGQIEVSEIASNDINRLSHILRPFTGDVQHAILDEMAGIDPSTGGVISRILTHQHP